MYTQRTYPLLGMLKWTRRYILLFFLVASIPVVLFDVFDWRWLHLPWLPISLVGTAVAFIVSFKNNASYDRLWEARKIWGGIVNYSRTWGNQVLSYVSNLYATKQHSDEEIKEIHKRLIYRHIGWLYALKHKLRQASPFSNVYTGMAGKLHRGRPDRETYDRDVAPFLPGSEYEDLVQYANLPTQLIRRQGEDLKELREGPFLIDDFRHMEMMKVLEEFYNLQGKCERINNTPFPRQFAYFSKVFVYIFIAVMPFGLIGEFAKLSHDFIWLTVPFFMLIAWIFITMETVGDSSEDPFENFMNDVPMTALTRTIEIDLRQMLGETDLPPKVQAVNDILM